MSQEQKDFDINRLTSDELFDSLGRQLDSQERLPRAPRNRFHLPTDPDETELEPSREYHQPSGNDEIKTISYTSLAEADVVKMTRSPEWVTALQEFHMRRGRIQHQILWQLLEDRYRAGKLLEQINRKKNRQELDGRFVQNYHGYLLPPDTRRVDHEVEKRKILAGRNIRKLLMETRQPSFLTPEIPSLDPEKIVDDIIKVADLIESSTRLRMPHTELATILTIGYDQKHILHGIPVRVDANIDHLLMNVKFKNSRYEKEDRVEIEIAALEAVKWINSSRNRFYIWHREKGWPRFVKVSLVPLREIPLPVQPTSLIVYPNGYQGTEVTFPDRGQAILEKIISRHKNSTIALEDSD